VGSEMCIWLRYNETKKKYRPEKAAKIAWGAVKKKYKKNKQGKWVLKGRSTNFQFFSEELVARSEAIGDTSRDYFIEGYLITFNPVEDRPGEWNMFTRSALEEIGEQIQQIGVDMIKGDVEHTKTRMALGRKITGALAYDEIMKLVDYKIDDFGLWTKWKLDKYMDEFPKIWKQIKDGFYNAFSVEAYVDPKYVEEDYIDGRKVRKILKARLKKGTLTKSPKDFAARVMNKYLKWLSNQKCL